MRKLISIIICAAMLCATLSVFASAYTYSMDDARENIDSSKKCSLTVTYANGSDVYAGEKVSVYKIADLGTDKRFTVADEFSKYHLGISGIKAQSEYEALRSTVENHISADNIKATASAETDEKGTVKFTGLSRGLYLVSAVKVDTIFQTIGFDSFLISLPSLNGNGTFDYEVEALPKGAEVVQKYETELLNILIVFQDDGNASGRRPEFIDVEILRNDDVFDETRLSDANNWKYVCMGYDDGADWSLRVSGVSEGYTVSIRRVGNTYYVTCTLIEQKDEPINPPTMDSSLSLVCAAAVCAGIAVFAAVKTGKGKRK